MTTLTTRLALAATARAQARAAEVQAVYAAEVAALGLPALLEPYRVSRLPEQRRACGS